MSISITHPIAPLYNEHSRVLILGSFPSVKSREGMFFYQHPQNRFWAVMAAILNSPIPQTVQEKKELLLQNRIALWDVIGSCEITGSSDASIRNVVPTDLCPILEHAKIRKIFCNGTTSWNLFQKYHQSHIHLPAAKLPSTSPANARWRLPELVEAWSAILEE